jgi:hypothetical protein
MGEFPAHGQKKMPQALCPWHVVILNQVVFSSQSSTCNGHPDKQEPKDKGEH